MTLLQEIHSKASAEQIAARDFDAIATVVSAGRVRPSAREIGKGTILEVLDIDVGNTFLDVIDSHPNFRHIKGLVAEGRLRIDSQKVQSNIQAMVGGGVLTQEQADALKALGFEPDPVTAAQCAQALDGGA